MQKQRISVERAKSLLSVLTQGKAKIRLHNHTVTASLPATHDNEILCDEIAKGLRKQGIFACKNIIATTATVKKTTAKVVIEASVLVMVFSP